ncbi:MAG: hypothetical protein CMJ74_04960 [Planctomycetaceae bacterium]|nr:hypothetical protein [Planctomycetaceae bacterium]
MKRPTAIISAIIGLLVFLSFSSDSHAQGTASPVEYVNRSAGTYATKYYFKNRRLIRHVTQIGNGSISRSNQGDSLYRKDRHSLATWTIRHGNSIYKMDAMGNIVGGSKRIGNRTYNLREDGKPGSYATRVGNTVYHRKANGDIKSMTIFWNRPKKKISGVLCLNTTVNVPTKKSPAMPQFAQII